MAPQGEYSGCLVMIADSRIYISTVLQKQLNDLFIPFTGCYMQCRLPFGTSRICIDTLLKKCFNSGQISYLSCCKYGGGFSTIGHE